jgi:hypothetical protein
VKIRKEKLGEDHPDTLASMHNLAVQYSEVGRRAEALRLTELVLELFKNKLGKNHPKTLASMHNLAIDYSENGRKTEALLLTEELSTIRKGNLARDHQDGYDERSFVDSAYGTASDGQFRKVVLFSRAEISSTPQDDDDATSEYSDISTAESEVDGYMECLADDLFSATSSLQWDPEYSQTLCKLLPDLLQEFALRIGLEQPSKENCEVMVFVHKYRR